MARQKKSALTAATVQSTQGNLIQVNFSAKKSKSQGLQEGKIIRLSEFRRLHKCPPNLKRVLQGATQERKQSKPMSVEAARELFDSIMNERYSPVRCPERSVQMVRDILVRGRV